MTDDRLEPFRKAGYLRLTSFKKDGNPVATPVWFVVDGDRLLMRAYGNTFKVKRMKRNPSVMIAPAGPSGDPKGQEIPGRAQPLSQEEMQGKRRLFARKYPIGYTWEIVFLRPVRKVGGAIGVARPKGTETFFAILPTDDGEAPER